MSCTVVMSIGGSSSELSSPLEPVVGRSERKENCIGQENMIRESSRPHVCAVIVLS